MGETGLACLSNTKLVCVPILRGGYRAAMATSTRRTVPWDRPLLAACLAPLGLVYRFVMFCRRRLYAMGVLTSHDLGVPVLSVGNLTVGGTGKSPMIDALLTRIAAQGKRAMVLSRGYGAAIDLEGVILNDEGHMLRRKHPEHVHVQGVNRVAAAQHALRSENVDVVLLDDGAQHLRVRRDCDLLLFDGGELIAPMRCLPAGPWRESVTSVRSASLAIVTGRFADEGVAILRELQISEVVVALRIPQRTTSLDGSDPADLEKTNGARVGLVSAIGRPDSFRRTAIAAGFKVEWCLDFADHDALSRSALKTVDSMFESNPVDFLLTTSKDAVKLTESALSWRVLEIDLEFAHGWGPIDSLLEDMIGGRRA